MPEVLPLPHAADAALVAVVHIFPGGVIEELAGGAVILGELYAARLVDALVRDGLLGVAQHAHDGRDGEPVDAVRGGDAVDVVTMATGDPHAAAGRLYLAISRVVLAS